jgi:ribosome-associated protein
MRGEATDDPLTPMRPPSLNSLLPEIELTAIHAAGPGGQNVNKVATAIQLRFDVAHSPALDDGLRRRLARLAGKRMSKEGVLVITARRHRSQEANRRDALDRLQALLDEAATPPRPRIPTRKPKAVERRRLDEKRGRAAVKRSRKPPAPDD